MSDFNFFNWWEILHFLTFSRSGGSRVPQVIQHCSLMIDENSTNFLMNYMNVFKIQNIFPFACNFLCFYESSTHENDSKVFFSSCFLLFNFYSLTNSFSNAFWMNSIEIKFISNFIFCYDHMYKLSFGLTTPCVSSRWGMKCVLSFARGCPVKMNENEKIMLKVLDNWWAARWNRKWCGIKDGTRQNWNNFNEFIWNNKRTLSSHMC